MFNLLQTRFTTYKNEINSKLKTILPKIRGGNEEAQLELTSILNNYTVSPFNYHTMKSFFDPRQKEIETVQNYIDGAHEIPKGSNNFAVDVGSSGEGNNCLISHEYTLIFDLRILPKTERGDNLVLDYIKAKGTWNEDNKWFKNIQAVLKQGEVFNRFLDFTKYNQDKDLCCFLIKLTKLGIIFVRQLFLYQSKRQSNCQGYLNASYVTMEKLFWMPFGYQVTFFWTSDHL